MEAAAGFGMAKKLEELPIYQKAMEFWMAVLAILQRPALGKDCELRDQINNANDSILSNMSEGYEQPTDKALASFLFHSKGSVAEVLMRLGQAQRKRYISKTDLAELTQAGEQLGKMFGGWIRYLDECDWKDRGRHNARANRKTKPGSTRNPKVNERSQPDATHDEDASIDGTD